MLSVRGRIEVKRYLHHAEVTHRVPGQPQLWQDQDVGTLCFCISNETLRLLDTSAQVEPGRLYLSACKAFVSRDRHESEEGWCFCGVVTE